MVLVVMKFSPLKARNFCFFAVSLLFYGWSEPSYVLLMLLSTVVDYFNGMMVEKYAHDRKIARRFVIFSIVFNLGLLGYFKYADFIIGMINHLGFSIPLLNVTLPVGISFYTFQTMSYPIDVYRQQAKAQKSMINFGTYVAMFPQLIAGPIVRYKDIATQLNEREETIDKFAQGVHRFCIGLFKKVIFANNAGLLFTTITSEHTNLSAGLAWLSLIAFALQIYFDFSGYSDMAIGLGKMFGFELLENFNYPYISKSISEFWRRWHISLGTWFKDYVYIPLGGNRSGTLKTLRNLAIVWFLTGLWHGASTNFVLWGLYFGLLIILERLFLQKLLQKAPTFLQHSYALFFILVGWMIFAFEDMTTLSQFATSLFQPTIFDETFFFYLSNYGLLLILCMICATPLPNKFFYNTLSLSTQSILQVVFVFFALVICTAYLVSNSFNPFLYFRF